MLARLVPIALAAVLLAGCEKTDHETIDKWTHTEKGAAKLKKTFADEGIDPDLSAHAGANMIKKGADNDARSELEQMSQARRVAVIGKLAPRLWELARVEGDNMLPGPLQIEAKDSLVQIRKYADDAERTQIDTYLTDWYCVASYDDGRGGGRASVGSVNGAAVIRMIGPSTAKKLMQLVDSLIAAPGQEKQRKRIGDELMLALAASGSPDAVKYVLDLAKMDRGDETLPIRALSALFKGYVDPGGLFPVNEPAPLVPNLDAIVGIAKDEKMPGQAGNDAVALIRVVGAPRCLAPLVSMIAHPHPNPRFKYVGADSALKCGGIAAIKDVVHALPDGAYAHDDLYGTVISDISTMSPRPQVLAILRELLADRSKLAQWVAMETLAAMKSVEDAPRIAAVSSGDRLVGYFGDQSDLAAKDRKQDPTLGQRAKELADHLKAAPK